MIADRATFRRPVSSHRLLYVGDIFALPVRLRGGLAGLDCFVAYSPVGCARTLIRSDIRYSLLLFDDTAAGRELEGFARSLAYRAHTPVMLVKESEDSGRLLDAVRRRLGTIRVP